MTRRDKLPQRLHVFKSFRELGCDIEQIAIRMGVTFETAQNYHYELERFEAGKIPAPRAERWLYDLSKSEYAVFEKVQTGLSNKQVADLLFVTEKTVKFHLTNIYKKLGVSSRAQMMFRFPRTLPKIDSVPDAPAPCPVVTAARGDTSAAETAAAGHRTNILAGLPQGFQRNREL